MKGSPFSKKVTALPALNIYDSSAWKGSQIFNLMDLVTLNLKTFKNGFHRIQRLWEILQSHIWE